MAIIDNMTYQITFKNLLDLRVLFFLFFFQKGEHINDSTRMAWRR